MSRPAWLVMLVVTVSILANTSIAAPPAFNVNVGGVELLPQSLFGAALFLFKIEGNVDGQQRRGVGWIAVKHDPLPETEGSSAAILGGEGAILVGLKLYSVDVNAGSLTLTDAKDPDVFDDAFEVMLDADISRRGETAAHAFAGELDHEPFPPTIVGELGVASASP